METKEIKLLIQSTGENLMKEIVGEPEDIAALIVMQMMFNQEFRTKMTRILELLQKSKVTDTATLDKARVDMLTEIFSNL
jgi:ketol-acid reductoisomerase